MLIVARPGPTLCAASRLARTLRELFLLALAEAFGLAGEGGAARPEIRRSRRLGPLTGALEAARAREWMPGCCVHYAFVALIRCLLSARLGRVLAIAQPLRRR